MHETILLIIFGLCFGVIIASGSTAFLISLGIIPRYAGITRTAKKVHLYEDIAVVGFVFGTLASFGRIIFPAGKPGLVAAGIFSGIFVGSWIIALAEILDIFPVLAGRLGLKEKMGILIICIALGKFSGSLLYFGKGWWRL